MKQRILILLCSVAAIFFAACTKNNDIPAVNGTINGIPALALYGTSGQNADYVLIVVSTNPDDRKLCYNGLTYTYINNPSAATSANNIYITISPTVVVRGVLDTISSLTQLTIINSTIFSSGQYTSR